MKTLFSIFLIAVLSASTFAQTKRVAVVQFRANKVIGASDMFFGLDNNITRHLTTIAEDPRFKVMPILEEFHQLFFKDFAPQMPVEVLPENVVLNTPGYRNYFKEVEKNPRGAKLMAIVGKIEEPHYIAMKGYLPLIEDESTRFGTQLSGTTTKNSTQRQIMQVFEGQADGVMFIHLDFAMGRKKSLGGFVTNGLVQDGRMVAKGRITLYNREGKRVFEIIKEGYSEEKYNRIAGLSLETKPEDLLPMCKSAAKNLFKELEETFPKMTRKVDAKL